MKMEQPPSHQRAITYRNKQFLYTVQGSGTVIMMVPPPGMGLAVYDKFKPLAKDYQLVRPDFLGWESIVRKQGESMIQLYITLMLKILQQEGIAKCVLMGYSAGGTIVQAFCLQHREKVAAVLLAGSYPKVATKGLDFQYKLGLFFLRRRPEYVIHFLGAAHARHKSFKNRLERKMMHSNIEGVDRFFTESYYYDCTDLLPACNIPFLTIYGENENWVSKHVAYYDKLPDHSSAIIEKSLHQHPVRKPEVMMHIIKTYLYKKSIYPEKSLLL